MLQTVTAWFTPARVRAVSRPAIEVAAALVYLLTAGAEQASRAGSVGILATLVMATTFLLYRIRPALAMAVVAFVALGLLVIGYGGSSPTYSLWLPILLVVFGASAYGRPVERWLALGLVAVATVLAATGGAAVWGPVGIVGGVISATGVLGLPWLAGYLLSMNRERRAAVTGTVAATARLGAARQEVSLEQERNRVARDVHDIVAHSLAVVIAQADGARYAARDIPVEVSGALENIATTARSALVDVRVLLGELRHSQEAGPQPGIADLGTLIRGFRESGLEIAESTYGEPGPLSDVGGLAVYRIVQEALTNALRHGSRATPVDLEFDWGERAVILTVTNELAGGAPVSDLGHDSPGRPPEGHGLPGMRERAALAGGEFRAGDGTGGRYRVRASIPLDRDATAPS